MKVISTLLALSALCAATMGQAPLGRGAKRELAAQQLQAEKRMEMRPAAGKRQLTSTTGATVGAAPPGVLGTVQSTSSPTATSSTVSSTAASAAASSPTTAAFSSIFASNSPYFAAAVTMVAVISFLVTLFSIWVIHCCVRRSRDRQNAIPATPSLAADEDDKRPLASNDIYYKERKSYAASETSSSSSKRSSGPSTTNGYLAAPPPMYWPVAQEEEQSMRQVMPPSSRPPSRPGRVAAPPYELGARQSFEAPRRAPPPPLARSLPATPSRPSQPSPLRNEVGSGRRVISGGHLAAFRGDYYMS